MSRRALLRVMLAAAAVPMLGALIVRKSRPAAAAAAAAAGAVTAFGATVTAGPTSVTVIIGTRSLSVRRILT